jgi:uncharacterized SAM-binding protein YcdF (DUF218 family)
MFNRKYTFESKTTRIRRIASSVSIVAFILGVAVATFIVYIPIYAKMQKGRAAGAFFQKSPDAIAVYTGDKGRIKYALDLLKKNPSSKLFISGVYATNSFQTLIHKQGMDHLNNEIEGPGMGVDLDYESKNTFENVRETIEFLQKNPQTKSMLIISSDYHIMRIKLIISHFLAESQTEFYFDSVLNDYSNWDNTRKLLKESVKILRTFLVIKIFREEPVLED